ncbi:MAG: hypothetical protein KBF76_01670 [Verrucomicrobiales bacterium]|jgi:hypothetical protein|nr:hypothetical protein [Verrucomicrobiales bacterium]
MNRKDRLQHILEAIPGLSDFRLSLIDGIITILERKRLRDSGETGMAAARVRAR